MTGMIFAVARLRPVEARRSRRDNAYRASPASAPVHRRMGHQLVVVLFVFASGAPFAQVKQPDGTAVVEGQRGAGGEQRLRADPDEVSKRLIASTNVLRRQSNLPQLEHDPRLRKAARYFADYMARVDKFGHDADGNAPAARAQKFGYVYCIVTENIAYQYSSAGLSTAELVDRLFDGWKNSPGHLKNMLDPDVTETAVAIARSDRTEHFYAVQMFGRPKSAEVEFSIVNRTGTAVEYSLDGRTVTLPPRTTRTHQGCRPSEITFQGRSVSPANGQQLVVVDDQGSAVLKAQ